MHYVGSDLHKEQTWFYVIDEKGKVADTKVLKSANPLLDAEAVRVVKGMPDWIPGRQKGEAVKVYFTLPIAFALK